MAVLGQHFIWVKSFLSPECLTLAQTWGCGTVLGHSEVIMGSPVSHSAQWLFTQDHAEGRGAQNLKYLCPIESIT